MPGLGTIIPVLGKPGVGTTRTATPGKPVLMGGEAEYLPGGAYLKGSKCRDPGNADDPFVLRCGLFMGRVAASPKHFAPSIIGTTQLALTGTGTTLSLTAAAAAEVVRRFGATGTFGVLGPPAAGGVVRTLTATYSAVNTTTGDTTITALGVNEVQTLTFGAAATGGTMRLIVPKTDGTLVTTDAITWNGTDATWLAAINTALDAATGVSGGIVATGAAPDTALTFTFGGTGYAGNTWSRIQVSTFPTSTTTANVVRTTTGVPGAFAAGSFVQPADGSEVPLTVICDAWGIPMPADGSDAEFPRVLVRGILDPAAIADWPTDTSLQAWMIAALKAAGLYVNASAYR